MSQGISANTGEMMTPEEIHDFGVGTVAKQLEKEGYELISVDPRMGHHPQIVATHKTTKAFIAVRTAVYPGNGTFESLAAARALIITAKTHHGIAYLASVGIANAAGFKKEKEDLAWAGRTVRGAEYVVNYRGLQPVVNLTEVKVLGPSGPEMLLPPSIDPQLLDETAATVAGALGVLDDLPDELANTVVNRYYRFLRFAKTRDPRLHPQSEAQNKSVLELFKQFTRQSSEAIADVKFIDEHIKAIRGLQPTTDRLKSIRDVMVQVTLDTFKYHIDDASKKNGIRRAIERKLKRPDEIEELYRFSQPLIADYVAENAYSKS